MPGNNITLSNLHEIVRNIKNHPFSNSALNSAPTNAKQSENEHKIENNNIFDN